MDRRRPERGGGALVLHLHLRFSAHHGQPSRRIQEQVVGGLGLILVLPQGPPRPLIEEPPAGGERSWQPWGYYNHGGGREAIARSCHIDATRGVQGDEDIAASDAYTLKSDSSSTWTSFPSRIPETVCTKNDATATYGVRLRRSLYGWKDNFITFLTPPDSGP